MSAKNYPTSDYLRLVLRYDDGKLFWRNRPRDHFRSDHELSRWNTRYGDKEAGYKIFYKRRNVYRHVIEVNTIRFLRSHLIFCMIHGSWSEFVDHWDCDTTNDRVENLRDCTCSQNAGNRRKPRTNTSGYKGVYYHKKSQKYRAVIGFMGKKYSLGYFDDPEDGHKAYLEAAKRLFKEFARGG